MQATIGSMETVFELKRAEATPADRLAFAIAIMETELEAATIGVIPATDRQLAELQVCLKVLHVCDEAHIDTTLAAIYEVRYVATAH